jgi:hypothetical protein
VSDHQDEDVQLRVSLETLARHIAQDSREQLALLRAGIEEQLSAVEAALNEDANEAAFNTTLKHISHAAADRAKRARQAAEAAATQALAAIEGEWRARLASETKSNAALRSAVEQTKAELKTARESLAKADAAQKTMAAQHRGAMAEQQKAAQALAVQVTELTAERADLLQRLSRVTVAKTAAEAQQLQLEGLTQKLSQALAQMLREREQGRTALAEPSVEAVPEPRDNAKDARTKAAPKRPAVAAAPPTPPAAAVAKKPLQFSQPARDAKRVKIRRGMAVDVDGIPGELVDLSLGGAQTLLRQAVKPNQLVQLMIPTSAGQIICKGRIVWSVFERPVTSLAVYRTGVKFTDVDTSAIETFMRDYADIEGYPARHSSGVA